VLCVGYACVDINFKAPHHPAADEKLRATGMHTCGGGPAANAAVAIARLGGSARFSGYLGEDAFGEAHLRELRQAGVLTDAVQRGPAATPVAAVTIKPDGARAIIDYRAPAALAAADSTSLASHPARVLLVDGHQPLLSLALVEEARALGIPSLLDAGSINDGTRLLYNQVDYLITSEKFARQYSGEDAPRSALAALDGSAPFIAVTWGAEGVYWQDSNGQHHSPALDIDAVDTTGAGDAFHGAFALGLAQGLSIRHNIRRATVTGGLTCLQAGARTALPHRQAVDALCQE
jgi:sulfofructose kinase